MFLATIWKIDEAKVEKLSHYGKYVAACLPKFVERVQVFLTLKKISGEQFFYIFCV